MKICQRAECPCLCLFVGFTQIYIFTLRGICVHDVHHVTGLLGSRCQFGSVLLLLLCSKLTEVCISSYIASCVMVEKTDTVDES